MRRWGACLYNCTTVVVEWQLYDSSVLSPGKVQASTVVDDEVVLPMHTHTKSSVFVSWEAHIDRTLVCSSVGDGRPRPEWWQLPLWHHHHHYQLQQPNAKVQLAPIPLRVSFSLLSRFLSLFLIRSVETLNYRDKNNVEIVNQQISTLKLISSNVNNAYNGLDVDLENNSECCLCWFCNQYGF